MGDAGLVSGVSHSLRISIWRSLTLLMHCLTDSSLHTSSGSNIKVLPYASPAASTSLSFFFRSRMVAMTDRERRRRGRYYFTCVGWLYNSRKWLFRLSNATWNSKEMLEYVEHSKPSVLRWLFIWVRFCKLFLNFTLWFHYSSFDRESLRK